MSDVIVDEVRRIREELIERYGGIHGYFKYCQEQGLARARREKTRRAKRKSPKKGTTSQRS